MQYKVLVGKICVLIHVVSLSVGGGGWGLQLSVGCKPISLGVIFSERKAVVTESSNSSIRLEVHDILTTTKMAISV